MCCLALGVVCLHTYTDVCTRDICVRKSGFSHAPVPCSGARTGTSKMDGPSHMNGSCACMHTSSVSFFVFLCGDFVVYRRVGRLGYHGTPGRKYICLLFLIYIYTCIYIFSPDLRGQEMQRLMAPPRLQQAGRRTSPPAGGFFTTGRMGWCPRTLSTSWCRPLWAMLTLGRYCSTVVPFALNIFCFFFVVV